jgi:hypothetical protein
VDHDLALEQPAGSVNEYPFLFAEVAAPVRLVDIEAPAQLVELVPHAGELDAEFSLRQNSCRRLERGN